MNSPDEPSGPHDGGAAAPDASGLPPVLTVDEAAAFLRINRNTLYTAIKSGTGPPVQCIGRAMRIHRDALLRWLGQGHAAPAKRGKR